MNDAEALVAAAIKNGIEICSPTRAPPRCCRHENVATGAADGYGRMKGRPALRLLHLGPGLANGLTNLHNARRAFTPVLNVIG